MVDLHDVVALKSKQHSVAGHYFHKLEICWGIPPVLISAIFAPLVLLAGQLNSEDCDRVSIADYLSTTGFVISGIASAINTFFRFGNRCALHHMYAAKYSDIVTDIQSEMVKKKEYRIAADVFICTMRIKYDNLIFGEPVIPPFVEKIPMHETTNMY